eukprot:149091_1
MNNYRIGAKKNKWKHNAHWRKEKAHHYIKHKQTKYKLKQTNRKQKSGYLNFMLHISPYNIPSTHNTNTCQQQITILVKREHNNANNNNNSVIIKQHFKNPKEEILQNTFAPIKPSEWNDLLKKCLATTKFKIFNKHSTKFKNKNLFKININPLTTIGKLLKLTAQSQQCKIQHFNVYYLKFNTKSNSFFP